MGESSKPNASISVVGKNFSSDFGRLVQGELDDRHYARMDSIEECYAAIRPYFMNSYDTFQYLDLAELRDFMHHFPEQQALDTYEYYKKCLQCIFYKSRWHFFM